MHNSCTPKSLQSHYIATNKSSEWTSGFEEIANKYGLDLSGNWNIISIEHGRRHPWEYHSFVDDVMNYVDNIANGDTEVFKDMWKKFGEFLKENPGMLYSNFWRK